MVLLTRVGELEHFDEAHSLTVLPSRLACFTLPDAVRMGELDLTTVLPEIYFALFQK
jgi:hypothetical protein